MLTVTPNNSFGRAIEAGPRPGAIPSALPDSVFHLRRRDRIAV